MKELPILFSGPMVQAILEDRKGQTRRAITPQPAGADLDAPLDGKWLSRPFGGLLLPRVRDLPMHCPYGQPGDLLWVREAWSTHACFDDKSPGAMPDLRSFHYWADGNAETGKKRPSIHMPRWASRITLEVTGVRVERLNDLSEADAKAEGADCLVVSDCTDQERALLDLPLKEEANPYRNGYALLWEAINGLGSWDASPWVWVVEFKRVQP